MNQVSVGSHETKLELVCAERRANGAAELIRARIVAPGLDVCRDAYEYDGYEELARFFESMSESWRGWSGEREYASLEGDLDITASHDGRHVLLHVRLQQNGPGDWQVAARLTVDPGEDLATAARAVRELIGQTTPRPSTNY